MHDLDSTAWVWTLCVVGSGAHLLAHRGGKPLRASTSLTAPARLQVGLLQALRAGMEQQQQEQLAFLQGVALLCKQAKQRLQWTICRTVCLPPVPKSRQPAWPNCADCMHPCAPGRCVLKPSGVDSC